MNLLALIALKIELRRWRARGRRPVLWWRDDDAREPTPALDRLLDLANGAPLSLAVIPDGDRSALAARLARAPAVTVSQHGVDHQNHSAAGKPPSEFGSGRPKAFRPRLIALGRTALVDAGLSPAFYTPPWNQIDPDLAGAVRSAGYERLSAYEGSAPTADLVRVDCDLDLMRWKGQVRFRGWGPTLRRLTRLLRRRRRAGAFEQPVGLLTHHLVQDERAWAFLAWFLAFSRRRFVWRSFDDLAAS